MANRTREPGEFCWVNILSPDTARARDFFASVLGWTYMEMPGIGHGIQVDGVDVGGIFDVVSARTRNGTAPVVGTMVKVDDADATCAKVRSLGGSAEDPFDIMDAGRMAVCHDPNGAQFDLWQPKRMPGTTVDDRAHGAPSWFETLTTDSVRMTGFYASLFDWTADVSTSAGVSYTTFKVGATPRAGMLQITPDMGPIPSHWGTYFAVDRVDVATATAERLGAAVFIPPHPIPGVGHFSGLVSPQGVRFYTIEYSR